MSLHISVLCVFASLIWVLPCDRAQEEKDNGNEACTLGTVSFAATRRTAQLDTTGRLSRVAPWVVCKGAEFV